jgi:(1->4)-alpha-D-glucan 1-alpha-D-glucosylmutase
MTFLAELTRREAQRFSSLWRELLVHPEDGRLKLYVTYKALRFRRLQRALFLTGDYLPLTVSGRRREHLVAFVRQHGEQCVLIAVPRLLFKLSPSGKPPTGRQLWRDTILHLPKDAPQHWSNILTEETLVGYDDDEGRTVLQVSDLFKRLPIAMLTTTRAT